MRDWNSRSREVVLTSDRSSCGTAQTRNRGECQIWSLTSHTRASYRAIPCIIWHLSQPFKESGGRDGEVVAQNIVHFLVLRHGGRSCHFAALTRVWTLRAEAPRFEDGDSDLNDI